MLPKTRCVFLSIPHGSAGYKTLENVLLNLARGDIVFDCRRDVEPKEDRAWRFKETGVRYIRCTVVTDQSQAAQIGSKKSESVPREVVSLLERVAANNREGNPNVDISAESKGTYHAEMVLRN
jgi:6-phosphogluconate dehydrogenase (decarboxylating)